MFKLGPSTKLMLFVWIIDNDKQEKHFLTKTIDSGQSMIADRIQLDQMSLWKKPKI
jgi:hypothetical protein